MLALRGESAIDLRQFGGLMLGWPRNTAEHEWGREFLFSRSGTLVQPDSHMLFWVVGGKPVWVTAFYNWMGWTCQGAFANDRTRIFPRAYIRACFTYVFNVQKRKMFFVGVNSTNEPSMRLQHWMGFKELWRGEALNRDGGDIVFLGMRREECRWIKEPKNVVSET